MSFVFISFSLNFKISDLNRNYSIFIDGMSIVDKHCQETTFDRNICIQMALLRIWSNIYERKTIAIITCDNDLQYFGKIRISNLCKDIDVYFR